MGLRPTNLTKTAPGVTATGGGTNFLFFPNHHNQSTINIKAVENKCKK